MSIDYYAYKLQCLHFHSLFRANIVDVEDLFPFSY